MGSDFAVIKTGIFYKGQEVQVTKGFYIFTIDKIDGYSWRIFDGAEDFTNSGRKVFATAEEAKDHAKRTVEYWLSQDKKRDYEMAEHRKLIKRVFISESNAKKAGIENPCQYICNECGATFWALYRSHYSTAPACHVCETADWLMIDYYFPKNRADGEVT